MLWHDLPAPFVTPRRSALPRGRTCSASTSSATATDARADRVCGHPRVRGLRWFILLQLAVGCLGFLQPHSFRWPRMLASLTLSQTASTNAYNVRDCAKTIFGDSPLAASFEKIVCSMGDDQLSMFQAVDACPLLRADAMTIIQHLSHLSALGPQHHLGISTEELEAMIVAVKRMLVPNKSLIDENGVLTTTLYHNCAWYDDLQTAIRVCPGPRDVGRHDVHFVSGPECEFNDSPQTLFAQAKTLINGTMRFAGLSMSLTGLPLLRGGMKLVKTHYNGTTSHKTLIDNLKAEYPNHTVKRIKSWKVLQGTKVSNADNWIVDQYSDNHATIATTKDMILPTDFIFARDYQNEHSYILMEGLDVDFHLILDENIYFVVIPRDFFAGGDSLLPPATVSMLNRMLRAGEYEDILSVMTLQEAVNDALVVTPSELPLEVLKSAYNIIEQFEGSGHYDDDYWPELRRALVSLWPLVVEV